MVVGVGVGVVRSCVLFMIEVARGTHWRSALATAAGSSRLHAERGIEVVTVGVAPDRVMIVVRGPHRLRLHLA